jgi:hypothetical protein
MRSLLIIALLIACIIQAKANCENATLVVHATTGRAIKVYIDGSTGTNPPSRGVTVTELSPGRHQLKVVGTFVDTYGEKYRRTIYTGTIEVHPYTYMEATVEEHRGVSVHETRVACGDQPMNQEVPGYIDTQSPNGNSTMNESQTTGQSSGNASQQTDQNTQTPAPATDNTATTTNAPASDADFAQIKATLNATKFESKKLDTLKSLVYNYYFTTAQVGVLMNMFSFESNKLEVAKYIYPYVVDKQNFGSLAKEFNFDARKEDFRKFMADK